MNIVYFCCLLSTYLYPSIHPHATQFSGRIFFAQLKTSHEFEIYDHGAIKKENEVLSYTCCLIVEKKGSTYKKKHDSKERKKMLDTMPN